MTNNKLVYDWIWNTVVNKEKNPKALCVFGPPASGKSLFTKIITDLVGKERTRHINPIHLNNKFNYFYVKDTDLLIFEEYSEEYCSTLDDLILKPNINVSEIQKNEKIIENNLNILLTATVKDNTNLHKIDRDTIILTEPLSALHILYDIWKTGRPSA